MVNFSLQSIILVNEESKSSIIEKLDTINTKLTRNIPEMKIYSSYESIMGDFIELSVNNITWDIGIQLQEFLAELDRPILFFGSEGSSLTDISDLKKGKFDLYISHILDEPDKIEEFLDYFLPHSNLLDYCLIIWSKEVELIKNEMLLEQLSVVIDYSPLKSLIIERLVDLQNNDDSSKELRDAPINQESQIVEVKQMNDESNDTRDEKKEKKNRQEIPKQQTEDQKKNLNQSKNDEIVLLSANEIDEDKIKASKSKRRKKKSNRKRKSKINTRKSDGKTTKKETENEDQLDIEKSQQSLDDFF